MSHRRNCGSSHVEFLRSKSATTDQNHCIVTFTTSVGCNLRIIDCIGFLSSYSNASSIHASVSVKSDNPSHHTSPTIR